MKTFKRIAATLLAVCSLLSLFSLVGCGGNETPAPQTECEKKGHEYSEDNGKCIRCEKLAVIPAIPSKQKYPLVEPCPHEGNCGCEYEGSGDLWNRVELEETCYTIEIDHRGELWLSFSAAKAGQYVLYSVGGNNGVEVERYNANAHYVPDVGKKGFVENGNFYSYVNCGEGYYNGEWRATYLLKGEPETQVKIRFVRIDEPAWAPKSVYTKIVPTQINGKKAEEADSTMHLVDVPYTTEYFYDETLGYYRMGTKEAPGEIIYVAIDRPAGRLFESAKFTNILKDAGTALNLSNGLTADDDYDIHCYTSFIMDWVDDNAIWSTSRPSDTETTPDVSQNPNLVTGKPDGEPNGDKTKNCYENFCNGDGVYPVNQELHTFLTLFTKANKPYDDMISTEEWLAQEDWIWLSACYYYSEVPTGTQENPLVLTEGTQNADIVAFDDLYCTVAGEGEYLITFTSDGADIKLNGTISAQHTVTAGTVFKLNTEDDSAATFTISVVKKTD